MAPSFAATSRIAALPEPLSLMPGPGSTLSRCAPSCTTLFGSPHLESAMTLWVVRISLVVLVLTWTTVPAAPASSWPTAKLTPTTGMCTVGAPRVPCRVSVRPGWPSFMMMTPAAPAACAFSALTWKVQVPRCTSATAPAGNEAKSAASQPEVELLGAARAAASGRRSGPRS